MVLADKIIWRTQGKLDMSSELLDIDCHIWDYGDDTAEGGAADYDNANQCVISTSNVSFRKCEDGTGLPVSEEKTKEIWYRN